MRQDHRQPSRATSVVPLGSIIGARSGDKGGSANVGVWIPDPVERAAVELAHGRPASLEPAADAIALADARYAWMRGFLTIERLRELLPEAAGLIVERHELVNLRAINFVIHGLLGRGVAESTRADPQAKGLGELLRARLVEIPHDLRPSDDSARTP
ncbi:MAG: hypothetical protein KGP12_12120 [Actinomycetales bacterium]|nr:hypothetical protein [Actinomycetales bacterium]